MLCLKHVIMAYIAKENIKFSPAKTQSLHHETFN